MSWVSFPYQILTGVPRPLPLCELTLLGPRGGAFLRALVDTGALFSIFPMKAAEDAGIMLRGGEKTLVQYGGSQAVGIKLRVYLRFGGSRYRAPAVFVERLDFRYALLGRAGLFSQFSEVAFLEKLKTPRVEFRA